MTTQPFTLTQLRYFAAVARLENMTLAAEHLQLRQSTLSNAISQLENNLATTLFVRHGSRGLRLTSTGRQLARNVKGLLEHADSLSASMSQQPWSLTGELCVGAVGPVASGHLPAVLRDFQADYPDVTVTLLLGDPPTLKAALREGQCDVALMYNVGIEKEFVVTTVEQARPHILVHHGHPAARRQKGWVSLADFASEPAILLDLAYCRKYYDALFAASGVSPAIRYRFTCSETVRSFVAAGHGYAVLNHGGHIVGSGNLPVVLRLPDELPPLDIVCVRLADVRPSLKTRSFEETCARRTVTA